MSTAIRSLAITGVRSLIHWGKRSLSATIFFGAIGIVFIYMPSISFDVKAVLLLAELNIFLYQLFLPRFQLILLF